MIRRLGAVAALAGLLVGPPLLLAAIGFHDWGSLDLAAPTGVRLLQALLTALGWLAWASWVVAVTAELIAAVSGRPRPRRPVLALPRALAGALVGAALSTSLSAAAHAAPPPATGTDAGVNPLVVAAPQAAAGAVAEAAGAVPARHLLHPVSPGDDLWSLAGRYYGSGHEWRRIVDANPRLADDLLADLTPGTTLVVPEPVALVTVRQGDTLSGLALRHLGDGTRWPEIHELNRSRVTDPDVIDVGWVLRVPMVTAASPPAPPPAATPEPAPPAAGLPGPPAAEPSSPLPPPPPPPVIRPTPDRLAPDRDESAVGAVLGGLTSLTAASVLGGVTLRRRLREQARPVGRRFVRPAAEVTRLEAALGVATEGHEPQREALIERALRHLARGWWEQGEALPELVEAVVGVHDLEFAFAGEPGSLPDGFRRLGSRVSVTWGRLRGLDDVRWPVAYPALVTLGSEAEGALVMVDLVASRVVGVRGVGGSLASEALSAMLVELSCAPWADEVELLVVTGDEGFARIAGTHRVETVPAASAAVDAVEAMVERRTALLAGRSWESVRLDPDLADAWGARIVLFETPPGPTLAARLETLLQRPACGVAAVWPVDESAGDATWELTGGARPTIARGGRLLVPQTIPSSTRAALGALLASAEAVDTGPAPWWSAEEPEKPEEPVNIVELRPRAAAPAPAPAPRLLLLGPVTLEGAAGEEPSRATRQCLEYCAWLLAHPGSSPTRMTGDLFVSDGTRRSNLSRLRTWLGSAPDGSLYLPDAYSGRIELHPAVTSDWHDLLALTSGGVNRLTPERLRVALELVRGAPLADAAPGQWGWAEELRADMVALVRDLGLVAARVARERGDLDTARWAANRALRAAPDDELLLAERIRVEQASGHTQEVDRLVQRLHRQARTLGVDLLPETVDLLQESVEGRLRARRA